MRDIQLSTVQSIVSAWTESPKTIRNLVMSLRSIWRTAKKQGHVSHHPFDGLVLPTPDPAEQPHFTVEQVQKIISAAEAPFDVVFWLIYETGIRRGRSLYENSQEKRSRNTSAMRPV